MSQNTIYTLGIDGGGSKTRAVVVDVHGNERGCGLSGSSNYHAVGLDQALAHIRAAVTEATSSLGCSLPLEAAWLGLAGIDRPADCDVLLPHLACIAATVRLTNDAELVLSALEEDAGVALVAGTGSIALGQDGHGTIIRCGGWGHLLGDEGSGYDIGRRTLQAVVRAADGRGPVTSLLERVLHYWRLASADGLIGKVYGDCAKATIAAISTLTFQAALAGDTVAHAIVEQAAQELALAVTTIAERLQLQDTELPLALGGGLVLHEASFRAQVLHYIRLRLDIKHVIPVLQPALSAARAALHSVIAHSSERMQA